MTAGVTVLDAPVRPLTAPERRRMWAAFASGYLVVGRNGQVAERHYREWCRLLGRPLVVVRRRGRRADVEMDTSPIGPLSPKALESVKAHLAAACPTGGAEVSESHVVARGVPMEWDVWLAAGLYHVAMQDAVAGGDAPCPSAC